MDFSYTPEQDALRDTVRRIFSERVTDAYWKRTRLAPRPYDPELWATLAGAGILGVAVPEVHGGSGLGFLELAIVLEEQGRALAPLPLLATLVLGALPLAEYGSERARARWIGPLVGGEGLLTAALHETGQTRVEQPGTQARADGATWRLTGEKVAVPFGMEASRVLVTARTDAGTRVFLVDPAAPGCGRTASTSTSGEHQATLVLDGVVADEMLGGADRGAQVLPGLIEAAAVGVAALLLGVAEEALRRTAEYVAQRRQFDRPVGSFQAVQQRAANAYIDVAAMRAALLKAAWTMQERRPAAADAAVALWWACRGADRVVHAAQHLHGGAGADVDYPIHRYFLWARQAAMTLGGAAPALEWLGLEIAAGRAAPLT